MGTFSRIRYVIAANTNALLEKAEDPEKLLRALIREMEDAGEDARLAAADLLAEQRHLERLDARLEEEIGEWRQRAEQAVAAGRDDLARTALQTRRELEQRQRDNGAERESLAARVAQLENDMSTLKQKLAQAKARLREMHVRQAQPSASATVARGEAQLSRNERKLREAMGRFDRLQNQVERLEARVRSYEVGGETASPWSPASSTDAPADPAVEAELEALKRELGLVQEEPRREEATAEPAPAETTADEDAADAGDRS
jgi:phage shock protein A